MAEKKTKHEVNEIVEKICTFLGRKRSNHIVDYARQNWGIERAQTYRYIRRAEKRLEKYSDKRKIASFSYTLEQWRQIKDQAYERKVVVGRGEEKQVVEVPDLNLVFDITKEEAKLMGIYPSEKHELTGPGGEPLKVITELAYKLPIKEGESGKTS